MRKFCLSFVCSAIALSGLSQKNGSVSGIATDAVTKEPIPSATVSILDKKDSSLVSFALTDAKGKFELKGLPEGNFRLLITHVNYQAKTVLFSITESLKNNDMGAVLMNDKTKTLNEIVLNKNEPPVTLIGDTVQYNAGSFKTIPNASVEQLLKKLPGVQVAKDGTVKAQGEKVTRVLVDGKEFFGSDPKMATKNLPADAVDKVQVYNKQSDQAALTGFEDGNYEKTINLKLKKDRKKGKFGKISAGAGTDGRKSGHFNINSFKGARQFSVIGMGNNTNDEGFSFMDIINFKGGLSKMMSGGNSFSLSAADVGSLGSSGSGVNTIWGSGLNYNNIIGNKLDLQSSYFYNHYNPFAERHTQRQYLSPGTSNIYNENSSSDNLNDNQSVNMNLLYQIDSFHSLRVKTSYGYQHARNSSQSDYRTQLATGQEINDGTSDNGRVSNGNNLTNSIMFSKKFRRRGRTFSATLQNNFTGSTSDDRQLSFSNFYGEDGRLSGADTINQHDHQHEALNSYNAQLVYTEPVFKNSLLEFSASKSNRVSDSRIATYDYNPYHSKYDLLNDSLTNNFKNTYGYTNGGVRIRTQRNKYNYSLGVTWQKADLGGKVISGIKDSVISKTFNNLLFNARYQYYISKFRTFSLTYRTYTTQPDISQLQPIPDVSDPLLIREGNPGLKQEYTHSLQANLNLVRPFNNKNLFFYVTFQTTQNKIVNDDSLDVLTGKRTTRPVNVNGVYSLNNDITYSMPLGFIKGTVEFSNRSSFFKGKQFINSRLNGITTLSLGPGIRFDIDPSDKLNLSVAYNLNYFSTRYSIQPEANNQYFTHEYDASLDWEMPRGFYFSTDFTYIVSTQRAAGFNTRVPVWNAYISKQMLRYNRGELKFGVRDLLDENIGITRNTNENYIEDIRTNTLRRFFMLSFTYSLSKTGLNKNHDGIILKMK